MEILLHTEHLDQCLKTLEASLQHLNATKRGCVEYDIFRHAVVKGFELTLEIAGKLLRRAIKAYVSNPRMVNTLTYKDVLREAAKCGLVTTEAVERWFIYRDNRNDTAHDYGEDFTEETLALLPQFIQDTKALQQVLNQKLGGAHHA